MLTRCRCRNFSDILASFQNLSIPQIISLVADLVVQFQDFPLFQLELPVLDQSIGDLVTFVSDKIGDLLGDFSSLRTRPGAHSCKAL